MHHSCLLGISQAQFRITADIFEVEALYSAEQQQRQVQDEKAVSLTLEQPVSATTAAAVPVDDDALRLPSPRLARTTPADASGSSACNRESTPKPEDMTQPSTSVTPASETNKEVSMKNHRVCLPVGTVALVCRLGKVALRPGYIRV